MQINSNYYGINKVNIPNRASFGGKFLEKLFPNKNSDTRGLDAAGVYGRAAVKRTTIIPPKQFLFQINKENVSEYSPSVEHNAKFKNKYVDNRERSFVRLKKDLDPVYLKKFPMNINTVNISNISPPHGTIAISGGLKEAFSTSGLWQCAGVAFVDKKHNLQTLMHFCHYVNDKENRELLKYILSYSKPEDLDITIVPGCYEETDNSISYLVDKIHEYAAGAKIKFAQFSKEDEYDYLVLVNGNLYSASIDKVNESDMNPPDKILVASST